MPDLSRFEPPCDVVGRRHGDHAAPRCGRGVGMPSEPHAEDGHSDQVPQPHDSESEGPVADAEAEAAAISDSADPLGTAGKPFDRRSPFMIGMAAAAGVGGTYGGGLAVVQAAA